MKKNLIISAAIGYKFNQIEFFLTSLRKYYQEDICFIIGKNDIDLEEGLKRNNCKIIKTNILKKKIQFERYKIFYDYIRDKTYNKILLCDSRDIYFQENPFNYNYEGEINFFLEDYLIGNCPFNSNWISKVYGSSELKKISNKTILCSGTVLGNFEKIIKYLSLMIDHINNFKYKKKLKYLLTFRVDPEGRGCDQGHANFIIHNKLINGVKFYTNSKGPIATAFYLKKIKFDKKFRLINELDHPYLLVHQYDKRYNEFVENLNQFKNKL